MKTTLSKRSDKIVSYSKHPQFPFLANKVTDGINDATDDVVFLIYAVTIGSHWDSIVIGSDTMLCHVGELIALANTDLKLWNGTITMSND